VSECLKQKKKRGIEKGFSDHEMRKKRKCLIILKNDKNKSFGIA
jgi:hypothetical protein